MTNTMTQEEKTAYTQYAKQEVQAFLTSMTYVENLVGWSVSNNLKDFAAMVVEDEELQDFLTFVKGCDIQVSFTSQDVLVVFADNEQMVDCLYIPWGDVFALIPECKSFIIKH